MEPDDRWQKVAVLMISLGEELAADLLRQFSDEDVGHITQAIADLKQVPAEVQDRVLSEFEDELRAGRLPFLGGEGFAKGLPRGCFHLASVVAECPTVLLLDPPVRRVGANAGRHPGNQDYGRSEHVSGQAEWRSPGRERRLLANQGISQRNCCRNAEIYPSVSLIPSGHF